MKLTKEQLSEIALGAVYLSDEDKGILFHRFTKEQENYYKETNQNFYIKALCPAGVRLSFKTDSSTLFIKGTTTEHPSRKYFAIDVLKNGEKAGSINNFEGEELASPYTVSVLPTGDFEKSFTLGTGEKEIMVHLPWTAITYFSEISLDDNACITPIKPKEKVLFFGDSITQGYDALYPSNRYAGKVANLIGAEEYNKAIGAEKFVPPLALMKEDFNPEYIIVAYGTNDWGLEREVFIQKCSDFYKNLTKTYKNSKIFAVTPIWRADADEVRHFGPFLDIDKEIKKATEHLSNVYTICGYEFVPADTSLYADFRLHPNDEGFEYQAKNLYEAIKKYL